MAVDINELFESRKVTVNQDGYTETRNFHIKGEGDPSEMIIQLSPEIGSAHPTLPQTVLKEISIEPQEALEVLSVTYKYDDIASGRGGDNSSPNQYGETWNFEMISQSRTINTAELDREPNRELAEEKDILTWQTMYYLKDDGGGAAIQYPEVDSPLIGIGDNADRLAVNYVEGQEIGVDVYRPNGVLRVNKVYPIAEVDSDRRKLLYSMQNTLNDAEWYDWQAEEVLFVGSNISYNHKEGTATIDYSFLFGPTIPTQKFVLQDPFTTDKKDIYFTNVKPFEYYWGYKPPRKQIEKKKGDPKEGAMESKLPTHLYRTRVYKTADFGTLGLMGPE